MPGDDPSEPLPFSLEDDDGLPVSGAAGGAVRRGDDGAEVDASPAAPAPDSAGEGDEVVLEPPPPDRPSRLTEAREARALAHDVTSAAYRSLWLDVITWPVRSGAWPAAVALLVVAALLSWFDGGATQDQRRLFRVVQIAIGGLALVVLGIYARRIVRAAAHGDRPVPWLRDRDDELPWWNVVGEFLAVFVIAQLPLVLLLIALAFVELPAWVSLPAGALMCLFGAAQFPLALVAATLRGSVLAAFPRTVLRVWRTEPHASRVAGVTSVAFVALLLISFALAAGMNPRLPRSVIDDHTTWRTVTRVGLTVLRFGAFYAALVSFRVAGLLVHEVPEVRESIR